MWLEKGVMDAGESTVITGKLISHTLSVRGQLKTEPGKDQDEEQWVYIDQKIEKCGGGQGQICALGLLAWPSTNLAQDGVEEGKRKLFSFALLGSVPATRDKR